MENVKNEKTVSFKDTPEIIKQDEKHLQQDKHQKQISKYDKNENIQKIENQLKQKTEAIEEEKPKMKNSVQISQQEQMQDLQNHQDMQNMQNMQNTNEVTEVQETTDKQNIFPSEINFNIIPSIQTILFIIILAVCFFVFVLNKKIINDQNIDQNIIQNQENQEL